MESLGPANLREIAMASQFDAIDLRGGARALEILRRRNTARLRSVDLLLAGHSMAMNEGRAGDALQATRDLSASAPTSHAGLRLRVLDALYGDGDASEARAAVYELENATTTGATMDGLTVQVIFSDSTTETLTWAATSVTAGAVTSANTGHLWSLTEDGNTFSSSWTLTNSATTASITDIILNGAGGGIIFDLTSTPDTIGNEQTPNSARGFTMGVTGGSQSSYNIAAAYTNIFSLVGSPPCNNVGAVGEPANTPCGDTCARLSFHFNTVTSGNPDQRGNILGPGQTFMFQADTDNIAGEFVPLLTHWRQTHSGGPFVGIPD
jgi:hypothetical protein